MGQNTAPRSKKRKENERNAPHDIDEIIPTRNRHRTPNSEGNPRTLSFPEFRHEFSPTLVAFGAVYPTSRCSQTTLQIMAHTSLQTNFHSNELSLQTITSARHQGTVCTQIGNDFLPGFIQRIPKSRLNFLRLLLPNTKVGVYSSKWQRTNLRLPQSSSFITRNESHHSFSYVLH